MSIKKVEVYDVLSAKYYDLDLLLQKDIPKNFWNQDKAQPSKYMLSGGSIVFDVPVDVTLVSKYRLTYDRNAHLFSSTDTTQKPGFDLTIHPILVYGPSMDWAQINGRVDIVNFCSMKIFGTDVNNIGLKGILEEIYGRRVQQKVNKVGRKSVTCI